MAVVGDDTELTTETVMHDATDMADLSDPNLMSQLTDASNDGTFYFINIINAIFRYYVVVKT